MGNGLEQTVAIVGSGPTAELFDKEEDIAIAINGAIALDKTFDYFLSSHPTAYRKSWFLMQPCVPRILNSVSAIYSKQMYPDEKIRKTLLNKYNSSIKETSQRDVLTGEVYNVLFNDLPIPAPPHLFFYFDDIIDDPYDRINRLQTKIFSGGTGACAALQVALIMGSPIINIYGCSFDNGTMHNNEGRNYACPPASGEFGQTTLSQRYFMERSVEKVRELGTEVNIIGKSTLFSGSSNANHRS